MMKNKLQKQKPYIFGEVSNRAKEEQEYSQTSLTACRVNVTHKVETADYLNGLQQYDDDDGNKIEVFMKDGKGQGILKNTIQSEYYYKQPLFKCRENEPV